MSGLINKVKDALHKDKHETTEQPEGTHGHHNNRAANAADPRIDSDRDHRAAPGSTTGTGAYSSTGTHTHGATGTHGVAGSHGIAGDNRGFDGPASSTDGPHSSNLANKADPRIDSDADRSRNLGANPSGTATTGSHNTTGAYGTTGTHNTTTGTGVHSSGVHGSTNAGPHSSNLANKADPRVDSDLDRGHNAGLHSGTHTTGTGLTGSHGTTGVSGTHGTHTTGTGLGSHNTSTNHGPHDSNAANKLDPRFDSDRDGRAAGTYGSTGVSGTHGTHTGTGLTGSHGTHTTGTGLGSHGTSTNAGPHDSNIANKADPRVDSDLDGRRGPTGTAGGSAAVGGFNSGTHTGAHTGTHNSGLTGSSTTGTHTGAHGTHGSGLTGASVAATGPADKTAGPHKSDVLNKVDPRVDSDLDGSKTYGGDKTYSQS
jgi:hypothetical protein